MIVLSVKRLRRPGSSRASSSELSSARIALPLAVECSGKLEPTTETARRRCRPGDLVHEAGVVAVEDGAVDGLAEGVEEALHVRPQLAPELAAAGGEPADLGTEHHAPVGRGGRQQALGGERADDPVGARAREADAFGELRQAEALRLVVERPQDLGHPRDHLDARAAGTGRRPLSWSSVVSTCVFGASHDTRRTVSDGYRDNNSGARWTVVLRRLGRVAPVLPVSRQRGQAWHGAHLTGTQFSSRLVSDRGRLFLRARHPATSDRRQNAALSPRRGVQQVVLVPHVDVVPAVYACACAESSGVTDDG